MNLRPCRIRMVNDGDGHFDEMDEYHRDGRYYYRDDVDQEIKHLIELQRAALAEAERALRVCAEDLAARNAGGHGFFNAAARAIEGYFNEPSLRRIADSADVAPGGAK